MKTIIETEHGNFIIIPNGSFVMGNEKRYTSYFGQDRMEREQARKEHSVKITNPIAVLETPVTVMQYKLFLKDASKNIDNVSYVGLNNKEDIKEYAQSDKSEYDFELEWNKQHLFEYLNLDSHQYHPLIGISYYDCLEYCRWLSSVLNQKVRLLSEAEWEFCCKAKSNDVFFWGNDVKEVTKYSWFCLNSGLNIQETKRLKSNPWGLYDMTGNVWEWCIDKYSKEYYNYMPTENPVCEFEDCKEFSIRGGSSFNKAETCRSTHRFGLKPETRNEYLGFRILIELS